MEEPKVLRVDLNDYTTLVRNDWWSSRNTKSHPELCDRSQGLKAAKHSGITKLITEIDQVQLRLTTGIPINDAFLKAFLGPAARKVGPDQIIHKIAVIGHNPDLLISIRDFLREEKQRIEDRAAKKKEEKEPDWSETKQFFLPEIGTKLVLVEDWEFDLYPEHRNSKLFEHIGISHMYAMGDNPHHVRIKEGSELTVDRIYIRKGVSDYSSVTFYLKKGATLYYNSGLYLSRGARFWAKLHDVNIMKVRVDLNTVPGLEHEE